MSDRLLTFTFSSQAQAAANGVHTLYAPLGLTLVGVTLTAEAFTGAPTGFNVDIQDDDVDVISAVAANSAGVAGKWLSSHLGGSHTPVAVAAGSEIEVDVNFSGGTSPTADYDLTLWCLAGTV
jgi:hypothetical protein